MRDTGLGGEQAVVGRKSAAYSAFKPVSPSPDLRHAVAMPDYRRNRIPGATYFFTVNLLERGCDLLVVHIDALRDAVRKARAHDLRSISTRGSSCRTTCTACGPFPRATRIFPAAGEISRRPSRNPCPRARNAPQSSSTGENAG